MNFQRLYRSILVSDELEVTCIYKCSTIERNPWEYKLESMTLKPKGKQETYPGESDEETERQRQKTLKKLVNMNEDSDDDDEQPKRYSRKKSK